MRTVHWKEIKYMLTVTAAVGLNQGDRGNHLDTYTRVSSVCFYTEAKYY